MFGPVFFFRGTCRIFGEVGGILDYAAEAKDGELPETVKPIDEEDREGGLGFAQLGTWIKTHGTILSE